MNNLRQLATIVFSLLVLILQTRLIGEGTELAFFAGLVTISTTFSVLFASRIKEYAQILV